MSLPPSRIRCCRRGNAVKPCRKLSVEPKLALEDTGVPGINILYNSKLGKIAKVVSAVVLLVIYATCTHQVIEQIKMLYSEPINVDVISQRREVIDFPTVSICLYRPFEYSDELWYMRRSLCSGCEPEKFWKINVFELLLLPNVTVDEIWNISSIAQDQVLLAHIARNTWVERNFNLDLQKKPVKTFMGTCLSLKLSKYAASEGERCSLANNENKQFIYDGDYTGIVLDLKEPKHFYYKKFTVILHEVPEELPLMILKNLGNPVYQGYEADVSFHIKEIIRVNTSSKPCLAPKDYVSCLFECTDKYIAANTTCKLPYLKSVSMNNCVDPGEARNTMNVSLQVYDRMYDLCQHCYRSCHSTYYDMNMDVIKPFKDFTRLKILLNTAFVEIIQEKAAYNFNMFISDIGGILGFFLGMCVLNVVQMTTSLLLWMRDWWP